MLTGAPLSMAFSQVLKNEKTMKATISAGTPMSTRVMSDTLFMVKVW
jgi:hypothetical protein